MRGLDRHQLAYEIASGWDGATLANTAKLSQGYPVELRALGVMQTIAFSMGKNDRSHGALASAIAAWVLSKKSGEPLGHIDDQNKRSPAEFLDRLARANQQAYLAADAEAIAFADAIKTISKALSKSTTSATPAQGARR